MSTLTIRIHEDEKDALDNAAKRVGFQRMKEGEMRGDITALLTMLARALPEKSTNEIKRFMLSVESEESGA